MWIFICLISISIIIYISLRNAYINKNTNGLIWVVNTTSIRSLSDKETPVILYKKFLKFNEIYLIDYSEFIKNYKKLI